MADFINDPVVQEKFKKVALNTPLIFNHQGIYLYSYNYYLNLGPPKLNTHLLQSEDGRFCPSTSQT